MQLRIVQFLGLLFTAFALVPAGAHLMELLNKIDLAADDYLTVQQLYSGWALSGILVFGALLTTLALTVKNRGRRAAFIPALIAFLCIAGTQLIFWTWTFPANQATRNWTMLPQHWLELRTQWEYSHAASAVLNIIALIAVIVSVLAGGERRHYA